VIRAGRAVSGGVPLRRVVAALDADAAGTAERLADIPGVKLRGHHALRLMAAAPDRPVDLDRV
jgi:hypothetical protein